MSDGEKLVTAKIAAEHLRMEREPFMRLCRDGRGPRFVRPGPKTMLFDLRDVDAWWQDVVTRTTSKISNLSAERRSATADALRSNAIDQSL